jgi:hypothetical protein
MKKLLLLALFSGSFCDAFIKNNDWKFSKGEVILLDESERFIINTHNRLATLIFSELSFKDITSKV